MSPGVRGFMTAAVPLGALIAAIFAGPIIDRFGRRRVLMFAAALFTVGALIAGAITAIWMLVAARLVLGVAIGLAAVGAPLYISETAPIKSRGAMVSTYQLAITIGILVSYLTGLVITGKGMWRHMFAPGRGAGTAVPGRPRLPAGIAALADPEGPRRPGAGEPAPAARRALGRRWRAAGDGAERPRRKPAAASATGRCLSRTSARR